MIIELPLGNACDGGPIHVLGKGYGSEYKVMKVIDFCGGKFPRIITGPSTFSINIDSVDIEGTNETIPAEKWGFKDNTIVTVK